MLYNARSSFFLVSLLIVNGLVSEDHCRPPTKWQKRIKWVKNHVGEITLASLGLLLSGAYLSSSWNNGPVGPDTASHPDLSLGQGPSAGSLDSDNNPHNGGPGGSDCKQQHVTRVLPSSDHFIPPVDPPVSSEKEKKHPEHSTVIKEDVCVVLTNAFQAPQQNSAPGSVSPGVEILTTPSISAPLPVIYAVDSPSPSSSSSSNKRESKKKPTKTETPSDTVAQSTQNASLLDNGVKERKNNENSDQNQRSGSCHVYLPKEGRCGWSQGTIKAILESNKRWYGQSPVVVSESKRVTSALDKPRAEPASSSIPDSSKALLEKWNDFYKCNARSDYDVSLEGYDFFSKMYAESIQRGENRIERLAPYPYLQAHVQSLCREAKNKDSSEIALTRSGIQQQFTDAIDRGNYAAVHNCLELCPSLIDMKTNINPYQVGTPLLKALQYYCNRDDKGASPSEVDWSVAHLLLIKKADPRGIQDYLLYPALSRTSQAIMQHLIDCKADVNNWVDEEKNTLLHCVDRGITLEAMKVLLRNGADVRRRNAQGLIPLQCLSAYNESYVARRKLIRDKTCAEYFDDFKYLDEIVGDKGALRAMPNVLRKMIGEYALDPAHFMRAVQDNDLDNDDIVDISREYLARGSFLANAINNNGQTALELKLLENENIFKDPYWLTPSKYKIIEALLKAKGLNINACNNDQGNTLLHKIRPGTHPSRVELLLEHKADPFIKNKAGYMPCDPDDRETREKLGPELCAVLDNARLKDQEAKGRAS